MRSVFYFALGSVYNLGEPLGEMRLETVNRDSDGGMSFEFSGASGTAVIGEKYLAGVFAKQQKAKQVTIEIEVDAEDAKRALEQTEAALLKQEGFYPVSNKKLLVARLNHPSRHKDDAHHVSAMRNIIENYGRHGFIETRKVSVGVYVALKWLHRGVNVYEQEKSLKAARAQVDEWRKRYPDMASTVAIEIAKDRKSFIFDIETDTIQPQALDDPTPDMKGRLFEYQRRMTDTINRLFASAFSSKPLPGPIICDEVDAYPKPPSASSFKFGEFFLPHRTHTGRMKMAADTMENIPRVRKSPRQKIEDRVIAELNALPDGLFKRTQLRSMSIPGSKRRDPEVRRKAFDREVKKYLAETFDARLCSAVEAVFAHPSIREIDHVRQILKAGDLK